MVSVSIIVPVYKVEKYLDQCVESILAQSFSDFELILVDDGSPDSCPAMCDAWVKKDSRVRVLHKENGGVWAARCDGIKAAGAEWLAFCDSDDWLEPDTLSRLTAAAERHNADMVQFCFWTGRDNTPGESADKIFDNEDIRRDVLPPYLEGRPSAALPSMCCHFAKKSLWAQAIGCVPAGQTLGEDYLCTAAMLSDCKTFVSLSFEGYHYRQVATSATHAYSIRHREQQEQFYNALYAAAQKVGIVLSDDKSRCVARAYLTCLWRCGISRMPWPEKSAELKTILGLLPRNWQKLSRPEAVSGPGCRIFFRLVRLRLLFFASLWARTYDGILNGRRISG